MEKIRCKNTNLVALKAECTKETLHGTESLAISTPDLV